MLLLASVVCSVISAAPRVAPAAQKSNPKPHIWLIVADDLGFGDLGYTGSSIKTPRIDALATSGTVLDHYYVNICCTPTRAMLMTGRYNIRYGLQTQVIPNNKRYGLNLDEKILPQYLNTLGYKTHAMGKWHLGLYNWASTPTFRGYDSFYGYYSGSQNYYTHKDSGFDFHLDVGQNCGAGCSQSLLHLKDNYSTGLYANHAASLIAAHPTPDTTPFFLYAAFQSVHAPIQAPAEDVAPYLHLHPTRQTFGGMLAALDSAIGAVQDAFVARGMWENTVTIFSTDNGGPVGTKDGVHPFGIGGATGSQNWPLRGGKGAYFQGGVRGTAWIHGSMLSPALKGTHSFELMHVTDILPTLVAAAGGDARTSTPTGKPLDGVNQWPMLTAGATDARADLLVNIEREQPTTAPPKPGQQGCNGEAQYVVVKGNYKLIVGGGGLPNDWYHDDLPYSGSDPTPTGGCLIACNQTGCLVAPQVQLFDVIADEAERHNLASSDPTKVAELMAVVHKYNSTGEFVRPLSITTPLEDPVTCPFNADDGTLTPCLH